MTCRARHRRSKATAEHTCDPWRDVNPANGRSLGTPRRARHVWHGPRRARHCVEARRAENSGPRARGRDRVSCSSPQAYPRDRDAYSRAREGNVIGSKGLAITPAAPSDM